MLEAVAEPLDSLAHLAVAHVDLLQPDAAELLVGRVVLAAVAVDQHRRERLGGDVEELDREQCRVGLGIAKGLPVVREGATEAAPLRVVLGRAHDSPAGSAAISRLFGGTGSSGGWRRCSHARSTRSAPVS